MPQSEKDFDEDIELSDAPPAGEDKSDSAPEDDSDNEEDTKLQPKATSNGTSEPVTEETPAEKKSKVEDMFDDDGDEYGMNDDEDAELFAESEAAIGQMAMGGAVGPSDPGVMKAFYQRLLPFQSLFQWLNHSPVPSNDFAHREFAFTLPSETYLRYQAFPSGDLLKEAVVKLNPTRFEIGPVYNANPKDRKQIRNFYPLQKELVFDIDMTDYDDIRTCCEKAKICNKCWSFVTMAIKVIDIALKEDFGFKHVLWVYSGRRGAHAWVCDKRARVMDDQKRRVVASYLEVVKGGSNTNKKVNVKRPLHPHLVRSFDILREDFAVRILEDQDPWRDMQGAEKLLKLIPDRDLAEGLRKKWESQANRLSVNKWEDIDALARTGVFKKLDTKLLLESKHDIILEYMYPRLDAEVSKHLNHLLKSPFCVHPGTGRVCVPIDASKAEDFDPLSVPTVTELLEEINQWDHKNKKTKVESEGAGPGTKEKHPDYEKTSLKPYVDFFKAFVASLIRDERKEGKVMNGDSMEY
ncbi:putative DNA primase small subunit [Terfezia boudieri ATCC MYA-4762]|uniref:DNA primase n=1 Tax=Terfezia boudieri ATCC MYA-4762 TaxID=1051890 RepID=A0A3N4LJ71_9PEZI|nr:putative DNA primase small subunit [Terfezia boudieri ATCC MYA-4762]